MKGELIFDSHQKRAGVAIKEISQSGIKLEQNSTDQVTGRINANGFNTVTLHLKTDGTIEWEGKEVMTTMEGDFIAAWGNGTGKNTSPTAASWEGEVHFMTQSPKLSWLNNTKGWVEGTGDQATGESHSKMFENK